VSEAPRPVSVVTGANSGIGRATAIQLARHGHVVYGTVRSETKAAKLRGMADAEGLEVRLVELDVADDDLVRRGFTQVLEETGRIDHLVNNAGVGAAGVTEETPTSRYAEVFNVNVIGAVRCVQAVLPQMRERGSGSIVNVSSITGRVAALAQSPYVTSKFALEGLSEGLAQEVAPFGIRVIIIEPGVTKTAIFARPVELPNSTAAYDDHYRRMSQFYAIGLASASDPFEVADVVLHAITTDEPSLRYAVSWGGPELVTGRAEMSDHDWVTLGTLSDDDEYYRRFHELFGLDIAPPPRDAVSG
jgi:NAD(P)-dependent dehydrogenase (short-subunit alcohol dehydrogenase family)